MNEEQELILQLKNLTSKIENESNPIGTPYNRELWQKLHDLRTPILIRLGELQGVVY